MNGIAQYNIATSLADSAPLVGIPLWGYTIPTCTPSKTIDFKIRAEANQMSYNTLAPLPLTGGPSRKERIRMTKDRGLMCYAHDNPHMCTKWNGS